MKFVPLPEIVPDKLLRWKKWGEKLVGGVTGKTWTDAADGFFRRFEDTEDRIFPQRGDWEFVGVYADRRGRQCIGNYEHLVWQFMPREDGRWDVRLAGTME